MVSRKSHIGYLLLSLSALILLCGFAGSALAAGSAVAKFGWVLLDETGNQSINYRSFDDYEGPALSLEQIRYNFSNGLQLRGDLKNISMNNRNMRLELNRPGCYGIELYNSQYRRVYSFEGDSYTRRNQTGGTIHVYPHKSVRLFAGGSYIAKSGETIDLFNFDGSPNVNEDPHVKQDYNLVTYNAGFSLIEGQGALRGEYRSTEYNDDVRPDKDQNRQFFSISSSVPVPHLEFITVHGGYRRFQTKYELDEFEQWSNFGWGGATVWLPKGFNFRYNFTFDRSGSDSDYVETDNIANSFFLGYTRDRIVGATVGYQHDINDDYEDEVQANSFYFNGWVKPGRYFELRAQYGTRAEEVKDGSRLLGDEDRSRHSVTAKYKMPSVGNLTLKYESRHRENDQLDTEVDFKRYIADIYLADVRFGSLSGGYAYSTGDYANIDEEYAFEFRDHLLYCDVTTREYRDLTGGFGATYYRSKRDLDVESFSLRFTGSYRFQEVYRFEVEYNVHNFDDLLVLDKYYTANIVEMSISRDFSL